MTAVIFGGGFGLYGYLPALLYSGYDVCLPRRYKPILQGREDGRLWIEKVHWVEDERAALDLAETIVIAKPPQYQAECVRAALLHGRRLKKLFLEKPLAPSPSEAADLLALLRRRQIPFKIAYLFLYEPWLESLAKVVHQQENTISIHWSFLAHHFRHDLKNWKREQSEGGGALRFYAIHLLAAAVYLGYSSVREAALEKDARCFSACLSGEGRADLLLDVDSGSETTEFLILAGAKQCVVSAEDPFLRGKQLTGILDYRVEVLHKYLTSPFWEPDLYYEQVIDLWSKVERKIGEANGDNSAEEKS